MTHLITVEIDQMSEGEAAAWIKAIAGMFGTDFVHECAEDIDPERVGEDDVAAARWLAEAVRIAKANETVTGARTLGEELKRTRLAQELWCRGL